MIMIAQGGGGFRREEKKQRHDQKSITVKDVRSLLLSVGRGGGGSRDNGRLLEDKGKGRGGSTRKNEARRRGRTWKKTKT